MANYPALYNGSDVFNNISGIPIDLVDRIEILPGGQSSLYGSDAIAGVINVILKKKVDGTVVSGRARHLLGRRRPEHRASASPTASAVRMIASTSCSAPSTRSAIRSGATSAT